ncbi:MAG: diacylglycerol/lipid kinase family protein [Kiritimatiellia bacterium]
MQFRKVRIFHNRKSGLRITQLRSIQEAVDQYWTPLCDDIAWYFPNTPEACRTMLDHALADGADCILVSGGDGTVSSIGRQLIGTNIPMGVIPLGSGNGVARHFNQSLSPTKSIKQIANGILYDMDVGFINGSPFLVSASVAWDAALVRQYNHLPMRGIGSYLLAAAISFIGYRTQPLYITIDGREEISLPAPLFFTIGNLSEWGGGARIDLSAKANDGLLELVSGEHRDAFSMLLKLESVFFDEGCKLLPNVLYRRFSTLDIHRPSAQPIQIDGELLDCDADIHVSVRPHALRLLCPQTLRMDIKPSVR